MQVTEIFFAIQGESTSSGLPTVFLRVTGCNLRCTYCDTTYAYTGGFWANVGEILERLHQYPLRRLCLTGGEPLAGDPAELQQLLDGLAQWEVSIETNGSQPLDKISLNAKQRYVMDLKCPSSGMAQHNLLSNISLLRPTDEVKFVIGNRHDYLWTLQLIQTFNLVQRCRVNLSPVFGRIEPVALAEWILQDGLDVRFQLQLHKILYHPDCRGV